MPTGDGAPRVESLETRVYRIPTEQPRSDGTFTWTSTTMVVVRARAAGVEGIGYTYASGAAATVVAELLEEQVRGRSALAPGAAWERMRRALRNVGRTGVASCALSAVDTALWDLKGRLLGLPLTVLLGDLREGIPAYGSGGFTSDSLEEIGEQLGGWVAQGMWMVKMKVARHASEDPARLEAARNAIGDEAELFVDANGAFDRKEALGWAEIYADYGVTWFEEPVSSDDLEGLRLLRDRGPGGMQIAGGEYGWHVHDFRDLLVAGAVDTLQADVTRCGGYTAFLRVGALCDAHHVPLSSHGAPTLHVPVMCAVPRAVHAELFHDHHRIEAMLLDGYAHPDGGVLYPDRSRPGIGFDVRWQDAERYRVRP